MSAILFGSVSTVADTSETQREAFNEAFRRHGLDWIWSRADYLPLLRRSGGAQRITEFSRSVGRDVDAAAIHRTKSEIFQEHLRRGDVTPRPGVAETIERAKAEGQKLALVTTTSAGNVAALLDGLGELGTSFDLVLDSTQVSAPKPDKAAYATALQQLGEDAGTCVAIEDNVPGVASAVAAGVPCVAFPNANTADHDFAQAHHRVERLDAAELQRIVAAA